MYNYNFIDMCGVNFFMNVNFLKDVSASTSAFRVVCGEMIINGQWVVHSEAVVAMIKQGTALMETVEGKIELNKGDVYYVAPNQKYCIFNLENAVIEVIILNLNNPATITQEFIPQSIIRGLSTGNCTHYAKVNSENIAYDKIVDAFDIIYKAEVEKYNFFQLIVHAKMYELFFLFFSTDVIKIYDAEIQSKKYRALRRVTEFVNEHFADNISLDTIATETNLSRYYISHLFKELMNTTFINYLNELRLSRAAMLLVTTDVPVIEIAGMSGFNNISNFNRSFKMYYDTTPSKYRKNEKLMNH